VYWLSRNGASPKQMKNCELAEFGLCERAMPTVPRTKQGFYDGVPFHRVIDGFMAQTGDPTGTGTGKSKLPAVLGVEVDRVRVGRQRGTAEADRGRQRQGQGDEIKALTKQGFYDGVPFHRVIDGFMAQTGDPTGTGTLVSR
jgi:cyclophilin family peptidyl-prolyl cis-trans isomerase